MSIDSASLFLLIAYKDESNLVPILLLGEMRFAFSFSKTADRASMLAGHPNSLCRDLANGKQEDDFMIAFGRVLIWRYLCTMSFSTN